MDHETTKGAFDLTSTNPSLPRGKNHLLAIAIDDYEHCSKLNNAVLDVEKFIEILTQKYTFENSLITKLTNGEATKRKIEKAFIKLARTVKPVDNVVIYFSGHGRYDKHTGGYWIPVEAEAGEDDFPDYIKNDLIKSYLKDIKSFHTFLIADSCFSGSLFIDKSKEKFTGDRRESEASRWGLTSGKKEIVSDGQPGEHSPFATALLDVLKKADRPPSIMHICDRVLEKVVANSKQTPMGSPLAIEGHQGGQFVFHFQSNEKEEWEALKNTQDHTALKTFLSRHPNGNFATEAEMRLARLIEEVKLENENSILLLYEFINKTNFTDLKESAKNKLFKIEDEKKWDKALIQNTISGFIKYLDESENGNFRKEAQEKIDQKRTAEIERNKKLQEENEALKQQEAATAEKKRLEEAAAIKKKQEEEKEAARLKKMAQEKEKIREKEAEEQEEAVQLKKIELEKERKRKKKAEARRKKKTEEADTKKKEEDSLRKKPLLYSSPLNKIDTSKFGRGSLQHSLPNLGGLPPKKLNVGIFPPNNIPAKEDSIFVEIFGFLSNNTFDPLYFSNVLGSFIIYSVILLVNYGIRFWVYEHVFPLPIDFPYPALFLALVFSLGFSILTLIIYWVDDLLDADWLADFFRITLAILLIFDLIYPFFYFLLP